MQIEWIRAFVLLTEKNNFSDAAAEMFVSQSSFSKYVKAFEACFETVLIDRSHHRISLTPDGEAVIPLARRVLEEYDGMVHYMQRRKEQMRQQIRISVSTASNASSYIRRILSYCEEHPEVELVLQEQDAMSSAKLLAEGKLDFLLGYTNLINPDGRYGELKLREEELFYVGCGEKMRGHVRNCVSLSEAAADRLILHENTRPEVDGLLELAGIPAEKVRPIATTTSLEVLKAYLIGGIARSILTRSAAENLDPQRQLTRLALKECPVLTLGILYRKETLSDAGKGLLANVADNT